MFSVSDAQGRVLRIWYVEPSYSHLTVRSIRPSSSSSLSDPLIAGAMHGRDPELEETDRHSKKERQRKMASLLKYTGTPGGTEPDPIHLLRSGGGAGGGGISHASFFGQAHISRTRVESPVGYRIFHAINAGDVIRVVIAAGQSDRVHTSLPSEQEVRAIDRFTVRPSIKGVPQKRVRVSELDSLTDCHVMDRGCIYKLPMAVNEERIALAGTLDVDALRLEQWPLTLEIHSAEALAVSEKLWSFGMHFEDRMAPEMFVYFQMQTQDLATSVEDDDTVSADDWRSPADRLMDRNIR
jgi:hypothetical protein